MECVLLFISQVTPLDIIIEKLLNWINSRFMTEIRVISYQNQTKTFVKKWFRAQFVIWGCLIVRLLCFHFVVDLTTFFLFIDFLIIVEIFIVFLVSLFIAIMISKQQRVTDINCYSTIFRKTIKCSTHFTAWTNLWWKKIPMTSKRKCFRKLHR